MKLEFAIIDSNTLSAMGLKQLLCDIIPVAEVSVMRSYEELLLSQPERFIHYFHVALLSYAMKVFYLFFECIKSH